MSSPETTWGVGEYPLMARHLQPAAVAAVDAAAVLASERVVDAAAGTGNAALVAAERGGQVIGVDFEPGRHERGVVDPWACGTGFRSALDLALEVKVYGSNRDEDR